MIIGYWLGLLCVCVRVCVYYACVQNKKTKEELGYFLQTYKN